MIEMLIIKFIVLPIIATTALVLFIKNRNYDEEENTIESKDNIIENFFSLEDFMKQEDFIIQEEITLLPIMNFLNKNKANEYYNNLIRDLENLLNSSVNVDGINRLNRFLNRILIRQNTEIRDIVSNRNIDQLGENLVQGSNNYNQNRSMHNLESETFSKLRDLRQIVEYNFLHTHSVSITIICATLILGGIFLYIYKQGVKDFKLITEDAVKNGIIKVSENIPSGTEYVFKKLKELLFKPFRWSKNLFKKPDSDPDDHFDDMFK